MVLDNKIHKPVEKMGTFFLGNIVDLLNMCSHGKNTLPARHRVGPDDGMFSAQLFADVLGCASWTKVNLEVIVLSYFVKARLGVGSRKPF